MISITLSEVDNLGLKPRPPTRVMNWAEPQNFFQTSNYDILQVCSLSIYKDALNVSHLKFQNNDQIDIANEKIVTVFLSYFFSTQ